MRGTAGNNQLTGGSGTDTLIGRAGIDTLSGGRLNDLLEGGAGANSLDGGTGGDFVTPENDVASYASSTAAVTVNLATGTGTGGDAQGDTITGVESLIGSAFADTLTGDANNNILEGRGGADHINGGSGGFDIASYASSAQAVTINLVTGVHTGGDAQGDVATNIDGITGTAFDDVFTPNGQTNVISGGRGIDTLSFAGAAAAVSLDPDQGYSGNAAGDFYSEIERLIGTGFNDSVDGDGSSSGPGDNPFFEFFDGGAGIDTLSNNSGNVTHFIGGAGIDKAAYTGSELVQAHLGAGFVNTFAHSAILSGVENLTRFNGAAIFTGDANANELLGGFGRDLLIGGAGNDTLHGGSGGPDVFAGGLGTDTMTGGGFPISTDATFIYAPGDGADTITNFEEGGTLGRIDLSWVSTVGALANINAITTDTGGGAKIDFGGGNSITLTNVLKASLTADDFIFHGTTGRTFEGGAIDNTWLVLHSNIDPLTNVRGDGGTGTDTFHLDVSNQANTLTSGTGTDTGTGSFGASTTFYKLSTGETVWYRNFETFQVTGGSGNDTFGGGALGDLLNGAGGNDTLTGLAGEDSMTGGDGVDTLNGGIGARFPQRRLR